jgi:hypothetical protein
MHLRQLIQPDADWLDAPSPRRVARVALLIALTLGCNGLLNGLLGLLLGTGLGFANDHLAPPHPRPLRRPAHSGEKILPPHWGDTFGSSLKPQTVAKSARRNPDPEN